MTMAATRVGAELAALARLEPASRALQERLLGLVDRAAGGAGAALYVAGERGWKRELASGAVAAFEDLLAEPPGSGHALAFPGGFVRFGAAVAEGGDPELAALVLALGAIAREQAVRGQLKRQDFEVKARGVQLEALYDVGLAIASTLDFDQLCGEILMRAVSLLDARRGALYVGDGSTMRLRRAFGGSAEPEIDPDSEEGRDLLSGNPGPNCCALPGAAHLLGVPIAADRIAKGILVVGDKESRRGVGPFPESDRRTLELLANQAAIALDNAELHRQALEKERLEHEIVLASEIQKRILPKEVPEIAGFELAGWNRPARHVGGDYFDFLPLPDPLHLGVVVGDVSGKGVSAALLVSTLHSSLRLLAERLGILPELFFRLNRHILDSSSPNRFITLFVAELDPASGELAYLNAGHNPGILLRAGGGAERLGSGGLPLGLMPGGSWRLERIALAPGDLLCLYSDGITEASDPEDEEFGLERLEALLEDGRSLGIEALVERIGEAVERFSAGQPQGDDQTVLLLRRG
jgi:sigma-B regulation protein RsbU (phosphoserine phosphatase)